MTESVPRLFVYFLGLYFVYIPLLWGWIRCALAVLDAVRGKTLKLPDMWIKIIRTIPGITEGFLGGIFFCSVLCLREYVMPFWVYTICAGILGCLTILVGSTVWRIWRTIDAELSTISDKRGS